jgi:hypothetical protein
VRPARPFALTLGLLAAARPAWAHHAGGAEESLGVVGYLLAGALLALAALAGWALFGPGGEGDDEDLRRPGG